MVFSFRAKRISSFFLIFYVDRGKILSQKIKIDKNDDARLLYKKKEAQQHHYKFIFYFKHNEKLFKQ